MENEIIEELKLQIRVLQLEPNAIPDWVPNAKNGLVYVGKKIPYRTSVNPTESHPGRWWIVGPEDFRMDYEREEDGDPTYDTPLNAIRAAMK